MLEPPTNDYPPVTIAPTSASSISASTPSAGSSHRPTSQNSGGSQVTLTNEMVYLLNSYRTGVATWMDIFDHDCTYQREVLRRCTTSELLVRSVCAFTAQNLSLLPFGGVWVQPATRYYGESLRILIDHIGRGAAPEDVLTSTMLLCSYEMIASHGVEHERHFYGAMLLILNHQISALSVGMDRANFWIYVRHEITVALVNETTLRISPQEWNFNWQDGDIDEDALANKLLWLLGRAINVAYSQDASSGSERQAIQTDALRWFHSLPPSFRGVRYGEPDAQGFSKAYFAIPAAAAAMMWYHLLHILLLAEPMPQHPSNSPQVEYHAVEIANIALSDVAQCVRSFSAQAFFFAAKHITGIGRKIKLWNLLNDLETHHGFSTRKRVMQLQQLVETSTATEAV